MMQGMTDQEIADKVGINRVTLNRWKNKDPHFIGALNSLKKGVRDNIAQRAENTAIKAYKLINKALDNELEKDDPNPYIALQYLKAYKAPVGELETDAEAIKLEQKKEKQGRELDAKFQETFSVF